VQQLRTLRGLRHLDIGGIDAGDAAMAAQTRWLACCTGLQRLHMLDCQSSASAASIAALAAQVSQLTTLTFVDMWSARLSAAQSAAFAPCLRRLASLPRLNTGDIDSTKLALHLSTCTQLTQLRMCLSQSMDSSAPSMGASLGALRSLADLHLH
jgi:hypothetical protein